MKKLILCAAAVVTSAGLVGVPQLASAQNPTKSGAAPAASQEPSKVGLIDMGEVFKNYKKLQTMTKELQSELKEADDQGKGQLEKMKALQEKIQNGTLTEGSPDYVKLESQFLKMQTELESYKKVAQRDFMRREADMMKTVYLEVEKAVEAYSKRYNYTLIIRFNRQPVAQSENAQEIMQSMNRQVVFSRAEDDITDKILGFINKQYEAANPSSGTRSAEAPARSGSGR